MRHCLIRDAVRAAGLLVLACVVGFPTPVVRADVGATSDPFDDSDDIAPDPYLADINTFGYWRTDKGPLKLSVIHGKSILEYPGFDRGMIALIAGNEYLAFTGDNGNGECRWGGVWARVLLEPDGPDRFVGSARICDGSTYRTESWNGVLVAGAAWFSPDLRIGKGIRRTQLDMSEDQGQVLMQRTHGKEFDPMNARSLVFDFTCDGGRDRVYLWNANEDELRLSVAHNQLPLFDGEDTSSVETIELGTVDHTGRGCPTQSAADFEVAELDIVLSNLTGAPNWLPTCSQILVGPGKRCRIYWDFESETFRMY